MVAIGGIQKFSTVDYPGYTVAAIFTIGCNMRCGYCHNPELVSPERYIEPIPVDDVLAFLETRRGLLDGVAISGGEPTEQPDLVQLVRDIKSMGFRVKLDTNGTHPGVIQRLINENLVDFIAMDIKGPLEKYSRIAARPVDLVAIQASIELIKTINHEFRTTIVRTELCVDDFRAIGEMVRGAQRYALQRFVPGATVSLAFRHAETFTERELHAAQDIMRQYVAECVVH